MKEPQEYKIHFHDFPLFFLLCLVDNIEFVKRQDNINENSSEDLLQQIEYSLNDTEGYRVWSSGYCEQWGANMNKASVTIQFLKILIRIYKLILLFC